MHAATRRCGHPADSSHLAVDPEQLAAPALLSLPLQSSGLGAGRIAACGLTCAPPMQFKTCAHTHFTPKFTKFTFPPPRL